MPVHVDIFVFLNLQLLATVLSQSAKAKEHLLEQSKSVDQPAGRTGAATEGWSSFNPVTVLHSDKSTHRRIFDTSSPHEFTVTQQMYLQVFTL